MQPSGSRLNTCNAFAITFAHCPPLAIESILQAVEASLPSAVDDPFNGICACASAVGQSWLTNAVQVHQQQQQQLLQQ